MEYFIQLLEKPTFLFTWLMLSALAFVILIVTSKIANCLPTAASRSAYRLVFSSTILSLLMAEGVLRIAGTAETYAENRFGHYVFLKHGSYRDTFHVHFPDSVHILGDGVHFAYPRSTNSLGVSSHEWERKKDSATFRIFALGDSFTEGDGAPADSAWPILFNEQVSIPDKKVEVLNAGVCGSDPFFSLMLLKHRLLDYEPDMVLVAVSIQDLVEDIAVRGGMERFDPNQGKFPRPYEALYAYSHILRLIYNRVLGYSWMLVKEDDQNFVELMVGQHIPSLFQESAELHEKTNLHFILYPHKHEYVGGYRQVLADAMKKQAQSNGVPFHDLQDCYRNKIQRSGKPYEDFWWKHDGHHNAEGYLIMSECIKSEVERHLIAK